MWAELQPRLFYLYLFILNDRYLVAFSFANKSNNLCKIWVSIISMLSIDPVVAYCMQIGRYNFTGEAIVMTKYYMHSTGRFIMISSFFIFKGKSWTVLERLLYLISMYQRHFKWSNVRVKVYETVEKFIHFNELVQITYIILSETYCWSNPLIVTVMKWNQCIIYCESMKYNLYQF